MNKNRKIKEILIYALVVTGLLLIIGKDTKGDFTFGKPEILGPSINWPNSFELLNCISSDGLEMYIQWGTLERGHWDICVFKRATTDSNWGPLENLGQPVNTSDHEEGASLSADGLTIYFGSEGQGGYGSSDIFMSTRISKEAPWGIPVNMGPKINSSKWDGNPWMSMDDLELYFISHRDDGYGLGDIWMAQRTTPNAPWEEPVNLGSLINSKYDETGPCLSSDGLVLLFSEHHNEPFRPGGHGGSDIWMSMRPTRNDRWEFPVNLGPIVNGPYIDTKPVLSQDSRTLYFSSYNRLENYGHYDIWQASIEPIVDLNGDGIVNATDMCIIVDNWGTDEPLCDIGPTPFGDGVVNVQDLIVLSEHLFEEIPPVE